MTLFMPKRYWNVNWQKKREDEYTKKMEEVTHQTRMNAVKSEELKVREKEANIRTKFGL